jgi:hypothetical protein
MSYIESIDKYIQSILKTPMKPGDTMEHRKVLSTILSLAGIPLLIIGIYLGFFVSFTITVVLGSLFGIIGAYLISKYRPFAN